ncbi:MAG: GNAT family N-acetyltransferase [Hydrococcus sp. RM1_1_31]|nr:GNAT family N-acetyltransferase [Hydrococcus sp. RM1_1_31]
MIDAREAKKIASNFSNELGFVNRAALEIGEQRNTLEIIPEIGFCHFHHRRDRQTTIYSLAVRKEHQLQGWGRLLFYRVLCSAIENNCDRIVAKCPEELSSNGFYQKLGFKLIKIEPGRKRSLNCWQYNIVLPLLFYCGGGGASRYDAIAHKENWLLGMRSCGRWKARQHMAMIDNHWKNYNHEHHLKIVRQQKPLIATAFDIEQPEQLLTVLKQASELARFCGRVLLIPKCKVPIPRQYWIGFSVPTSYGGTTIECNWFGDRLIHLLGGSPDAQAHYARHLNVVSLDGNYACKIARWGKSCWQGNNGGIKAIDGNYSAFRLSLEKQKKYWHQDWHWSEEPLFKFLNN